MKEHETTLANIAKYEDILNNYDSMAQVIIDDLDALKKEYAVKRKTKIENAEEAVFEENKVQEQEVVLLMDRFGYAKTVDGSVYERNREAADKENKYIPVSYTHLDVYKRQVEESAESAQFSVQSTRLQEWKSIRSSQAVIFRITEHILRKIARSAEKDSGSKLS